MFKPRIGATCVKLKSKDKKTLGHLDPETRRRLSERAALCESAAEGSSAGELRPSCPCPLPGLEPFEAAQEAWVGSWALQAGAPPALVSLTHLALLPAAPPPPPARAPFLAPATRSHLAWKPKLLLTRDEKGSQPGLLGTGKGGSWGEVTPSGRGEGAAPHPTQPPAELRSWGDYGARHGTGEHLLGRLQGPASPSDTRLR